MHVLLALLLLLPLSVRGRGQEAPPEREWPAEVELEGGRLQVHEPQLEGLEGDRVRVRTALVHLDPAGDALYGAAWFEARIETDFDLRLVELVDLRATKVSFGEDAGERAEAVAGSIVEQAPGWDVELALDRLIAALAVVEEPDLARRGFDDRPPRILFAERPTVLLSIDGPARLQPHKVRPLQVVQNTPYFIVHDPEVGRHFLSAGLGVWYGAPAIDGPWVGTSEVPFRVVDTQPKEAGGRAAEVDPTRLPEVVVATQPTELIVSDGPPALEPLVEDRLLQVRNTTSDWLFERGTGRHWVLLSGRWYASTALAGPGEAGSVDVGSGDVPAPREPWTRVPSTDLPEDFARIPVESDRGYLLTWVAGTAMAAEAAVEARIPQTASIERRASVRVSFFGREPEVEKIEGTSLSWAVNTTTPVVRVGRRWWAAVQGAWFVTGDPRAPWRIATEEPPGIETVPPSSPIYPTRHLRVYGTTEEVVHVGYETGYVNGFVDAGCPVFGTGWHYRAWWSRFEYVPCVQTWGFHARWNPWYGWGFGGSFPVEPLTFSIGVGRWYRRGWWGAGGWNGYSSGYSGGWHRGLGSGSEPEYRDGTRTAADEAPRNLYRYAPYAESVRSAVGVQRGSPLRPVGTTEDLYVAADGKVLRRQREGGWQERSGRNWISSPWKDPEIIGPDGWYERKPMTRRTMLVSYGNPWLFHAIRWRGDRRILGRPFRR